MFTRYMLLNAVERHEPWFDQEQTPGEKKRRHFGNMFTLHALLNRASVEHENKDTPPHMDYQKPKEHF